MRTMSHAKEASQGKEPRGIDQWERAAKYLRFLNVDFRNTLRVMWDNGWEVEVDGRVDRTGCYVILTDQNAIENHGTSSGKRVFITSITEGRKRVANIRVDTVDGDGKFVPNASQISISNIKSVSIGETGSVLFVGISNDEQVRMTADFTTV